MPSVVPLLVPFLCLDPCKMRFCIVPFSVPFAIRTNSHSALHGVFVHALARMCLQCALDAVCHVCECAAHSCVERACHWSACRAVDRDTVYRALQDLTPNSRAFHSRRKANGGRSS